jgi:hypothetical protein
MSDAVGGKIVLSRNRTAQKSLCRHAAIFQRWRPDRQPERLPLDV